MIPSELLAKTGWIKARLAIDKYGICVSPKSSDAVAFCLVGACRRCDSDTTKLKAIIKARGFLSVADFNDRPNTKHADVLSVLKEAGL